MVLTSVLRDLYVPIPGYGRARLNAAYFPGGETLLKETLTKNFGITIDRTVTVHFSALADMVDDLGGIEIDITEEERRHLNKLLKDVMTKLGFWHDDAQVALEFIQKSWATRSGLYVAVEAVE